MRDTRPQILETVGWPAERVAATVGTVALLYAVTAPVASRLTETFTSLDISDEIAQAGYGAALVGLVAGAAYHRIGQRRQTIRDRYYD